MAKDPKKPGKHDDSGDSAKGKPGPLKDPNKGGGNGGKHGGGKK